MKLTLNDLKNKKMWEEKGYVLPHFDREQILKNTHSKPEWIHFGSGNIFRAFPAMLCQNLINQGLMDTGIIVAEGFDYEIIKKINEPFENLSVSVTLKADGKIEKTIVSSIVKSLSLDDNDNDKKAIYSIFTAKSLKIASFTITEKGYNLKNINGEYLPAVVADFDNEPTKAQSYIGKIAALLLHRYNNGKYPLSLVSMDNCAKNGDKLKAAVLSYAENWNKNKFADNGFIEYISNPEYIAFPQTMIDKITPRPDLSVKKMLESDGFEDSDIVITQKGTYTAAFVNAEEAEYLVIEDLFPNGKLPLEKASKGVIFTDRETVDKVEKMKVCTCLNPLHTALAIFGCLLDYKLICDEMKNPILKKMVEIIGYKEGLPVVVDPVIISPKAFIDEVMEKRIPNPFMPDTPQRIATDTSQKLSVRFGETIKAYDKNNLDIQSLKMIPLVLAGWCRYLLAVDDNGKAFELSKDPMIETVTPYLKDISIDNPKNDYSQNLYPILSNPLIFGVNLYEVGLGKIVEGYFAELCQGKGAVISTIEKYLY